MVDVNYNTDIEYRICIRQVFCMIPSDDSDAEIDAATRDDNNDDGIDAVTRDENDYDEVSARKALDYIYENTNEHPLFMKLYEQAAGHMLSLDKTIGLSVLCSYDYLHLFHKCIQCFMSNTDTFTEIHPSYVKIKNAL
jgi:hypothetical protein